MIYKRYEIEIGHQVIEILDQHNATWDLWNAEDVAMGDAKFMEIGTDHQDLIEHLPHIKSEPWDEED